MSLVQVPSQPHTTHPSPSPCQPWGRGPAQGVPGRSLWAEWAQLEQNS